ncbi:MAG: hypothetical protein E6H73_12215 [Betaproteobacteria bacterium]|nr:MAG: hypothetical protein E6H73_12215 [Betaproteobacteria bacterium]
MLTGVLAESWVRDNFEGFISNWENSEKQVLLARVVFDVAQRYNSVLGVGPGMLGSRAASAASADVLYKETGGALSNLLGPAPKPERWAMYGLWDAEVVQGVTDKSALLTMPFSGCLFGCAQPTNGLYCLTASWRPQHRNRRCGRMCGSFANPVLR